jgi:hypothetical protein
LSRSIYTVDGALDGIYLPLHNKQARLCRKVNRPKDGIHGYVVPIPYQMVSLVNPQLPSFYSIWFMDLCRPFLALFDPFPAKSGKKRQKRNTGF